MADVKSLGDQLVELTVKEVNELASYLKETHGIEPAAAAVVAGPAAGAAAPAAEKTNFDVVLKAGIQVGRIGLGFGKRKSLIFKRHILTMICLP